MTDRSIIFSPPMVRALLDGRKTQTRRVLKPQPVAVDLDGRWYRMEQGGASLNCYDLRFAPGDRLYVREAFRIGNDLALDLNLPPMWVYRATSGDPGGKWRSPFHMPRQASRLTLTVTDVRVQRLQEISEADAWAEGCAKGDPTDSGGFFPAEEPHPKGGTIGWDDARDWFADIWDSLHGADAWDANPWVAAVSFTVARCNIDRLDAVAA